MPKMLFDLSEQQAKALRDHSRLTGIPVVGHVRTAIDRYLFEQNHCTVAMSGGVFFSGKVLTILGG